jgi:hypothetical protein
MKAAIILIENVSKGVRDFVEVRRGSLLVSVQGAADRRLAGLCFKESQDEQPLIKIAIECT